MTQISTSSASFHRLSLEPDLRLDPILDYKDPTLGENLDCKAWTASELEGPAGGLPLLTTGCFQVQQREVPHCPLCLLCRAADALLLGYFCFALVLSKY